LLDLSIFWVKLLPCLVVLNGFIVLTHSVESHSSSLISLTPVTLDFNALFTVLLGLLELVQVVVGGWSVRVEGVVAWSLANSVGEVLNSLVVILCDESFSS
jgi:hypothetical protein